MSKPPPVAGDMGLGLCLACVTAHKQAVQQGKLTPAQAGMPQFAVTMAPTMVPVPGPLSVMTVAVPACYDHLAAAGPAPQERRPLLVAGGVPG
jgi:hypothetical protein